MLQMHYACAWVLYRANLPPPLPLANQAHIYHWPKSTLQGARCHSKAGVFLETRVANFGHPGVARKVRGHHLRHIA